MSLTATSTTRFVNFHTIVIPPRQRKEIPKNHIADLKRSISSSKGLMHAPVMSVQKTPEGIEFLQLAVGECRLRAMIELHQDTIPFTYDRQNVPLDEIPYVLVSDLSEDDLAEAEFEENILRAPLNWIEQQNAIALIHNLRLKKNPEQTISATAREIVLKIEPDLPPEEVKSKTKTQRGEVSRALVLSANQHNPRVYQAKNASEAYRNLIDQQDTRQRALLAKLNPIKSPHQIILGDCRDVLKTLPDHTFNALIFDPPYGIDADKMKKGTGHFYDDSPIPSLDLCRFILTEAFRLLKPKGIIFMFCDVEHFLTLREVAQMQCLTTWRTPIIWKKGGDGQAPWGAAGFQRTTEMLLFAVKGEQPLQISGGPDCIEVAKVSRFKKLHAAEKPVELMSHLLERATIPGDHVLDPCCGSGSIIPAADKLKVKVTAIEIDETYHAEALSRLTETEIPSEGEPVDAASDDSLLIE